MRKQNQSTVGTYIQLTNSKLRPFSKALILLFFSLTRTRGNEIDYKNRCSLGFPHIPQHLANLLSFMKWGMFVYDCISSWSLKLSEFVPCGIDLITTSLDSHDLDLPL